MTVVSPVLTASALCPGYRHSGQPERCVAGPLELELYAGQLVCLLGPNGCGKSTLLRTLSGLQPALSGQVQVMGQPLNKLKPLQVARLISLVLTDNVRSGNLSVYELVALGRFPYSGWLGLLSEQDRRIIDEAIRVTYTSAFIQRKTDSLSDGECQKVMLARAIAQDTPLILLDEPTAHLDLPSRIQLMRLLHQLARETGKAIVLSTHELDLALQIADQVWLMDADGGFRAGMPEMLVLSGAVGQAFSRDGIDFEVSTGSFRLRPEGTRMLRVTGSGDTAFWTRRALLRNGFSLENPPHGAGQLLITEQDGVTVWQLTFHGISTVHQSLTKLLEVLNAAEY